MLGLILSISEGEQRRRRTGSRTGVNRSTVKRFSDDDEPPVEKKERITTNDDNGEEEEGTTTKAIADDEPPVPQTKSRSNSNAGLTMAESIEEKMAEIDELLGGGEKSTEKWSTWRRRVRRSYAKLQQSSFVLPPSSFDVAPAPPAPPAADEGDIEVSRRSGGGAKKKLFGEEDGAEADGEAEDAAGQDEEDEAAEPVVQRREKKITYTSLQRATMVFEEV